MVLDYVTLLLDKLVGRWVPVRFLMFTAVGSIGVVLHMAVLAAAMRLGVAFLAPRPSPRPSPSPATSSSTTR